MFPFSFNDEYLLYMAVGKKCDTCSIYKNLNNFQLDFYKKDGYKNNCKICYRNYISLKNLSDYKCLTESCNELSKYNDYCKYCFLNKFMSDDTTIKYKIKKNMIEKYLKKYYSKNIICSFNFLINLEFSPDILIFLLTHVIIIQIDENQNKNENYYIKNKKINELISYTKDIPYIFIKFNIGKYSLTNGEIYKSCFKKNNYNYLQVNDDNLQNRLKKLKETIDINIINKPSQKINNIYLFYDD